MDQNGFDAVIASHKGRLKITNEDNGIVRSGINQKGQTVSLCAVADGMGGLEAGDLASKMATEYLSRWWNERIENYLNGILNIEKLGTTENLEPRNKLFDLKIAAQELGDIFNQANIELIQEGNRIGKRIGTTLSVMFHIGQNFIIIHIGDSRIYHLYNNIEQLTEDHSWVAQQVRNGRMTKDEAANHSSRHILTECLGVNDKIHLYFNAGTFKMGEIALICSDGFYTMVEESDWKDYVQLANDKNQALQVTANALIEMANNAGGEDNITVILAKWGKRINWFNKLFS